MRETPEFIDTYSDDLLYLIDLRDSYLTHPGKVVIDFLFQASISRLFCVFMIGGIEAMIENWKERDTNNILEPYFAKSSNEDRITALSNSFKTNRIDVDEKILKQYLAIKYVRNTIVHSGWNENQKDFITEQGFPTDTRKLTDDHLQIMYAVNNEMMMYIASIQLKNYIKLGDYKKLPDYKRYFTKNQLAGFLWQNLEKINSLIGQNKEITQDMLEEALYDWSLYKELVLTNHIDISKLENSSLILQKLVDERKYSKIPIGYLDFERISSTEIESDEFLEFLSEVLNLKKEEVLNFIEAYNVAKKCYERMKNITASSLLKKLSKSELSISSYNIEQEAELAEKTFKLGRLYYDYAEQR
ncbi:hypothetical protein [Myroides profundi]|uniref:Uncharacterized protein n=1 Tax=Myroides profundi TaxID=480520 RepID=A0AAJ4W473_MYRPR|nr:hypothetical protein [Myroides profundi]AJH14502.1 hypothetical protein MPR_1320 [Myroides profundi]SEQ94598.1 hypothetical protein SAMN04488089_107188 [Myroides profundi]